MDAFFYSLNFVFLFFFHTANTPTPAPAAAAEHAQNAANGDAEMVDEWTPVTNKKGKARRQPKQ